MKATAVSVPQANDITRITPEFERYASIEAIEYQLKQAKYRANRLAKLVGDLEALRDARLNQIEAGEWPRPAASGCSAKDTTEATDGN